MPLVFGAPISNFKSDTTIKTHYSACVLIWQDCINFDFLNITKFSYKIHFVKFQLPKIVHLRPILGWVGLKLCFLGTGMRGMKE